MPPSPRVDATLAEKLDVVVGVLGVLTKTIYVALRYPFSSKTQPTLGRELFRYVLRSLLDRLNVAQIQWIMPSSTAVYKEWIAKNAVAEGVPAEVVTDTIGDEGAKLHWIGRKDAKKVILHFHGGGYVMPLQDAHLRVNNYIRQEVKRRSGVEVKLAFLEYTLLPASTYPTQFRQAVLALKHILDSGISSSDIVIAGDSAGGQLAMQIVGHLLHPHPAIPALPVPAVPLAGIIAISPWVLYNSDAHSFVNNDKDVITSRMLVSWGQIHRERTALANGGVEPEGSWGEALKAPPEWWRDTAKVTRNVLITYGAYEAFLDDNVAFAKKLREAVAGTGVNVQDVEEPQGLHIGPQVDGMAKRATPSELTNIIAGWVNDRLAK